MADSTVARATLAASITTNNNHENTGARVSDAVEKVIEYAEAVDNAGVENASIVANETEQEDEDSIYSPWLDKVTKILRFKSLIPENESPFQIKPLTGTGGKSWYELAWNVVADVPFGFKKITNLLAGTAASHAATVGQVDLKIATAKKVEFNRQTASYTLVLGDAYKAVEMNVAGANNLTVPPNADVAFENGTEILIVQYGAGQTTVVAGAGVTIRNAAGMKLTAQNSGAALVKLAANEWYLFGDLTT